MSNFTHFMFRYHVHPEQLDCSGQGVGGLSCGGMDNGVMAAWLSMSGQLRMIPFEITRIPFGSPNWRIFFIDKDFCINLGNSFFHRDSRLDDSKRRLQFTTSLPASALLYGRTTSYSNILNYHLYNIRLLRYHLPTHPTFDTCH